MKSSLLIVLCLLGFELANAQTVCPFISAGNDVSLSCGQPCANLQAGYTNANQTNSYIVVPIPYQPNSYSAGTQILNNIDDHYTAPINLPFPFCFFGNTYNSVLVGSNGMITFDLSGAGGYNPWGLIGVSPLPNPALPTNSIMGVYQDIDPTNLGAIYFLLTGTYPCRKLIVSFDQVPYYADPNSVAPSNQCQNAIFATTQIVLYETTNIIDIYIQSKPICTGSPAWNGALAIEGIQNSTGTVAYTVTGRNNTVWTATNNAYRFMPNGPSIATFKWFDLANNQVGTGANTQVCPTSTTSYVAEATYAICDGSNVVLRDTLTVTVNNTLATTASVNQNVSCVGNDGIVQAQAPVGTPPLQYQWSTGATTATVTGLSPGTYTCTVTDANGCFGSDTTTLAPPIPLSLGAPVVQNITCHGGNDGSIGITPANGAPPYIYLWSNGATTATATTLSAGSFTVTVTDAGGCTSTANASLVDPAATVFTTSSNDVQCNGNADGEASVAVSAGNGPFNYAWNTTPVQNGATATNLIAGNYICTVSDINGCTTVSASIPVNQPALLTAGNVVSQPYCAGSASGSINENVNGGVSPYIYVWSPSVSSGSSATSLLPGTYYCTITDDNGCTYLDSAILTPQTAVVLGTATTDITCNGLSDGTIQVNVNGGTAPFNYAWLPNVSSTAQANNIPADNYTITVTDVNGCSSSTSASIIEPPPVNAQAATSPLEGCLGQQFTLTANGGFSYLWSDGSTSAQISVTPPAGAGQVYSVTVTDAAGCTGTTDVSVDVFNYPVVVFTADTVCENELTSFYNNTTTIPAGSNSYIWKFGDGGTSPATAPQYAYASAGIYTVWLTATSSHGCADSSSGSVRVWELPTPDITSDINSGCPPLLVTFEDKSTSVDGTVQSVSWGFGNGGSSNASNPTTSYINSGLYDVQLITTSSYGCVKDSTFNDFINAYWIPVASFTHAPEHPSELVPTVEFYDKSVNAASWLWYFGDAATSTDQNPKHRYPGPGEYPVVLTVESQAGCIDSTSEILIYLENTSFWVPTAFTPNKDGKNDVFKVNGLNFENFNMSLYTRWGETVYASSDPEKGWDGTMNDTEAPSGTYVYLITYRDLNRKTMQFHGTFSLIR